MRRIVVALAAAATIGLVAVGAVVLTADDEAPSGPSASRTFDRAALDRQAAAQAAQTQAAQDDLAEKVRQAAERQSGRRDLSSQERAIVEASRTSTSAPRAFRERPRLDSCGELALTSVTGLDPVTFDCLVAAPPAGAELVILRRTVEGDPVVRYYRVSDAVAGVEVFSDSTLDRFGVKGWTREVLTQSGLAKLGI